MATTLEIVRGISQVLANSYDGALDDKGEPIKVGLKREEGHPILDSRVMDGFKCAFHGSQLRISYHAEIKLKDVHTSGFESDLEKMIADIAKFLKKEYKKVTGNALTLKANGDVEAIVQQTSRIRCWVQACQMFDIGGIDALEVKPDEKKLEAGFKTFIDLGGWGGKAKNDTRKE